MKCLETKCNDFETLKARRVAARPENIAEKLAEWAFEDAETVVDAIRRLVTIDCAGCHSPAPIYYHDMAAEVAEYWTEIDDALDSYREATGESWTPRPGQNFLTYLWFAYEWKAHELADEIRRDCEAEE